MNPLQRRPPERVFNSVDEDDLRVFEGFDDNELECFPSPSFPNLKLNIRELIKSSSGAVFRKLN
ncbi:hypothetical protein CDL15_Pgr004221 [Punica granatum]|uniref:Uncharacterized protein n=2 Tax=Punica granatum TaxID=22663 RepID=A0A218XGB2_PUNGR|nr:hypothetical protein CDL15_Pgr004221 [Punica granatum]